MSNELLDKIYSNISYNNYKKMQLAMDWSTVILGVPTIIGVINYPDTAAFMPGVLLSIILVDSLNDHFIGQRHTKEMVNIKRLYSDLLNDLNALRKVLDMNNPLEIYNLYYYMLYNGYLSKDKKFACIKDNVRDIKGIYGTNVVLGSGVCRHIATFLKDFYVACDMDSVVVSTLIGKTVLCVNDHPGDVIQDESKQLQIAQFFKTTKPDLYVEILDLIYNSKGKVYLELLFEEDTENSIRQSANHLITAVMHDGISYIVDPTQVRVYHLPMDDDSRLYDTYEDDIIIKYNSATLFDESSKEDKIRDILAYPSITPLEEQRILSSADIKCISNNAFFEDFYREHKELYEDMANNLMSISESKNPFVRHRFRE